MHLKRKAIKKNKRTNLGVVELREELRKRTVAVRLQHNLLTHKCKLEKENDFV